VADSLKVSNFIRRPKNGGDIKSEGDKKDMKRERKREGGRKREKG